MSFFCHTNKDFEKVIFFSQHKLLFSIHLDAAELPAFTDSLVFVRKYFSKGFCSNGDPSTESRAQMNVYMFVYMYVKSKADCSIKVK
jgi:hypothetical protein